MQSINDDSFCAVKSCLSDMSNIFDKDTSDEIIMGGDFNCESNWGTFDRETINLLERHALYMII